MPWYTRKGGKRVYSATPIPEQDLDSFLDDVDPEPEQPSLWSKISETAEPVRRFMRSVGNKIEAPLTGEQIGNMSMMSRSGYPSQHKPGDIPREMAFLSGAVGGTGEIGTENERQGLSMMMNPIDVASTATGMGAGMMGARAIAKGVSAGSKLMKGAKRLDLASRGLSALPVAHGAINVIHADSTPQERMYGAGEAILGSLGMRSNLPSPNAKVPDSIDFTPPSKTRVRIQPDSTMVSEDYPGVTFLDEFTARVDEPTAEVVKKLKREGYQGGVNSEGIPTMTKPRPQAQAPKPEIPIVEKPYEEADYLADEAFEQAHQRGQQEPPLPFEEPAFARMDEELPIVPEQLDPRITSVRPEMPPTMEPAPPEFGGSMGPEIRGFQTPEITRPNQMETQRFADSVVTDSGDEINRAMAEVARRKAEQRAQIDAEMEQPSISEPSFARNNVADFDPTATREKQLMSEMDSEVALDNFNQLDQELEYIKLHEPNNVDAIEETGYLRDVALDRYQSMTGQRIAGDVAQAKMTDINEPSAARIGPKGDTRARMDIGDRKEMIKIFRNTYAGSVPHVAGKELLQNAIDAAKLNPEGKVDIDVNAMDGTITVSDNGTGMSLEELQSVYTNLSESGKRGKQQGSIGELGVGKTTYLVAGDHVAVSTVWRDPKTGKLIASEFDGTPEQIMEGFDIDQVVVPEGTPTGTRVMLKVDKDSDFDSLENYLDNFESYSNNPVPVNVSKTGKYAAKGSKQIAPRQVQFGEVLHEGATEGTNYKLSIPEDANYMDGNSIHIIVSNRGMFQGVDRIYTGAKARIPDRIIIELDPKVQGTDSKYPLTAPTRERLKDSLRYEVQDWVNKNIVQKAADERQKEIIRIYNQMQLTSPNPKFVAYDTGGRFTPDEMTSMLSTKTMDKLGTELNRVLGDLTSLIPGKELLGKLEHIGFVFDQQVRGVNIENPAGGKYDVKMGIRTPRAYSILVNPFARMANWNPNEMSRGLVHTLVHEFTHIGVRDEGADFTSFLADVFTRFPLEAQHAAQQRILSVISDGAGNYTPEVQDLLLRYTDSRGRAATNTDILIGERGSKSTIGEGPQAIPISDKPDGAGTLAEKNARFRKYLTADSEEKVLSPILRENLKTTLKTLGKNRIIKKSDAGIIVQLDNGTNVKIPFRESKGREIYNTARGLIASYDISAPFRQGLPLAGTKAWFQAWNPMFQSLGNEQAFQAIMDNIRAKPYFKIREKAVFDRRTGQKVLRERPSFAEEVGLRLSDLDSFTTREENMMGGLAERIPVIGKGVRASNRAYTAFLNELRANTFERMMEHAKLEGLDPTKNLEVAKTIAEFVNDATGRGSLKQKAFGKEFSAEPAAKILSNVLFSPRLLASRVRFMNPGNYIFQNPTVRQEYVKSILRIAGTWALMTSVMKLGGAEVSLDPTNSDFGKAKQGNTRIDPGGGFQQYMVAAMKLLTGRSTSSTTGAEREMGQGFGSPVRWDTIQEFGINKLHPVAKFGVDLLRASKYHKFNVADRTAALFLPAVVQDTLEVIREDPNLMTLLAIPASSIGMGTQTYEVGGTESKIIPEEFDYGFQGGSAIPPNFFPD